MQAERGRFPDWSRCFTFFNHCNLHSAAGLSPEAEITWQWGLHGELLADPLPDVTDGCGICGGSHGSTGPQSQFVPEVPCYFPLQREITFFHAGPCLLLVVPSIVFSSEGLPCPWRTSKLWFKGSEAATGQTAASLKRLPACIAPEHTILLSTPWENILTQAFIGDHYSLPIY